MHGVSVIICFFNKNPTLFYLFVILLHNLKMDSSEAYPFTVRTCINHGQFSIRAVFFTPGQFSLLCIACRVGQFSVHVFALPDKSPFIFKSLSPFVRPTRNDFIIMYIFNILSMTGGFINAIAHLCTQSTNIFVYHLYFSCMMKY